MSPESGGWHLRSMALMSARVTPSRENSPPCITMTFPPRTTHSGSALNSSVKRGLKLSLYLARTSPSKPYIAFMVLLSWFPRVMKKWRGYATLHATIVSTTSTPNEPRSTKSPLNRYGFVSEGRPFSSKMLAKSKNWPWTSPQTVNSEPVGTGTSTSDGSSEKILHASFRRRSAYLA
eukprot:Amastigsp_a842847_614.p3 type:complete len:177 gc:universal Amastigsp_a842847_614:1143-613(-)